jgi:crotonobetaine/carnitine-CoA ligase
MRAERQALDIAPAEHILKLATESRHLDPHMPILTFEDGLSVTRAELFARAERFAGYLRSLLQPGDRVAIMLGNRAEYFIAWFATMANRATLVSINPRAMTHDAGHILRDSQATVAIVSKEVAPLVMRLQPDCPDLKEVIVVRDAEPDGLDEYHSPDLVGFEHAELFAEDVVSIYYTSGTTGPPKGCMLDHTFWLRFVDVYLQTYGIRPDDRLLCWFQFFYVDPPWMLLASLRARTRLIVMRRFSVSRFWPVVQRNRVTQLFGSASAAQLLLGNSGGDAEARNQVRFAVHVGIPKTIHQELVSRWGFPWVEAYGLTETGLVLAVPLALADKVVGSGAVGLPCPDVSISIVNDDGVATSIGETGEILVQAPGLFRGYLNQPAATQSAMKDGWFHTGDLGFRDADGFIHFAGRKKDIIRRSGENIASAEVEDVLRSHSLVLDAAVIPVPDPLHGEAVKAYILPISGITSSDVRPEDLLQYCRENLAPFKVPRYFEYRYEDFPRTPSMRVKKEALRDEREDLIAGCWDSEEAI